MLPPEPPKIPTFPNKTELQRSIATVFEDLEKSVLRNIGTPQQGVVCVPLLYFVAHVDTSPPDENQEVTFLRRPETLMGLTQVTSKVLMRDAAFLSAITHSFADVLANFFNGVGTAMKQATPEVAPETKEDVDEAVADADAEAEDTPQDRSNVLPFRGKKKFMPDIIN